MLLKWTPNLSVHVVDVDKQHIDIFKRMNSLIFSVMNGKGEEEIKKTLDFLGEYVTEHFAFEEKLMQEREYPEFPAHKEKHTLFIADLAKFKAAFEYGGEPELLVAQIHKRISDWWMNHIAVTDRAMGLYVKEN